jgi:hypothetical protein
MAFCLDYGIGMKLGVGFPFFSGNDYQDLLDFLTVFNGVDAFGTSYRTRFKLGFSVGVFVTLGLVDFFAIQPEAIITFGGGAFGFPENEFLYSVKEHLNSRYVELPVLAKLRFGGKEGISDSLRYSLFAGPGIAFKIADGKDKLKIDDETVLDIDLPENFFADNYYFLVFGLGLNGLSRSNKTYTTFEIRYHMGLNSVLDESNNLDDFKENNIQVLIGFGYGSKGNK